MIFSIIIPAYNEERDLPGCLQSLKQQNFDPQQYEVIVIDNGSTDKTPEIVSEYGAKLIVNHEKNVSGLRNLGADVAKGQVLAFIDADCIATQDWLSQAQRYIDQEDIAAWGAPPGVPEDGTWVQKSWFNLRKKNQTVVDVDWLESMNLFVRSETFKQLGGFNETLVTCEDVDFSYRLSEQGRIIADSDIEAFHLGEAKDIREFIRKEFWRGLSNYHGFFSHKFKLSELPSLAIPIYFAIFIPVLIALAIVEQGDLFKWAIPAALIIPMVGVWFKLLKKKLSWSELVQLQVLINIYFWVRTASAFKGLLASGKS